jgi:hypothetical protein
MNKVTIGVPLRSALFLGTHQLRPWLSLRLAGRRVCPPLTAHLLLR